MFSLFEMKHVIQNLRSIVNQCEKDVCVARENFNLCKSSIGNYWDPIIQITMNADFLKNSTSEVIDCAETLMGREQNDRKYVEMFAPEIKQQIHTAGVFVAKLQEISRHAWILSNQIMSNIIRCEKIEESVKNISKIYIDKKNEANRMIDNTETNNRGEALSRLVELVRSSNSPMIIKNMESTMNILEENIGNPEEFARLSSCLDDLKKEVDGNIKQLENAIRKAYIDEIPAPAAKRSLDWEKETGLDLGSDSLAVSGSNSGSGSNLGSSSENSAPTIDENRKRIRLDLEEIHFE